MAYFVHIVAFKAMLQLAVLKMLGLKIILALLECFVHAIIIFFNVKQLVVGSCTSSVKKSPTICFGRCYFFPRQIFPFLSFPN